MSQRLNTLKLAGWLAGWSVLAISKAFQIKIPEESVFGDGVNVFVGQPSQQDKKLLHCRFGIPV